MVLYCFPTNEGMISHDLGPGPWNCACFIFHSFYWTCIDWQTHTYLPNALQHADYSWVAYRLIWKLLALKSNKSCDRSQRAETDNRTTHALSLDPATTHISYVLGVQRGNRRMFEAVNHSDEHRALPGLCVWLRSYALEWHRIWRWRAWLEVLRPIPGAATEIVGASKGPVCWAIAGKNGENLWGVAKAQKGVWFCVILRSGQCWEHLDLGLKWVWWMWMDVDGYWLTKIEEPSRGHDS